MDLFQDEQHVRLRNLELDKYYLHAADDGEGISISKRRNSVHAAWKVHIYHDNEGPHLLLHSAAYGRYLAATNTRAPLGHLGFRAEQRDYDQPVVQEIMWQADRSGSAGGVLLRNIAGRYLRANGKFLRWNNRVTVEDSEIEKVSTMMRWIVEPIRLRDGPPRIPPPIRARLPDDLSVVMLLREPGVWRGIRFVHANPAGAYPEEGWPGFHFRGRSLNHLRNDLAGQVHQQPNGIVLCVRAGRYGRPTPLVVDLPRDGHGEILQIIVFTTGTPGYNALRYPYVDGA